jgi:hypothetical protein
MQGANGCVDPLLQILACVVEGAKLTYVSGAITSGRRLLEACRSLGIGSPNINRGSIIESNVSELRELVASLRKELGGLILDPSRLPLFPGWSQQDYYRTWGGIVRRYPAKAIFADDWQYSCGCSHEYLSARSAKIVIVDRFDQPISDEYAMRLLKGAIRESAAIGLDATEQRRTVTALEAGVVNEAVSECTTLRASPLPVNAAEEIAWLTGMLATVIDSGSAVYVSAPINSGRRKYFALPVQEDSDGDKNGGFKARVLRANVLDQQQLVKRVGAQLPRETIIDPVKLPPLPKWSQGDFHRLWACVIEAHAAAVVFADGWEYSDGCTLEFSTAAKAKKILLNAQLSPMTIQEGVALMRAALTAIYSRGLEARHIEGAVHDLTSVI